MAGLAGVPDIMGTLMTLKDQIREAEGLLVSAREESATSQAESATLREEAIVLRKERADLLNRLARSEDAVNGWRHRLVKDVQAQGEVVWDLARRLKKGHPKVDRLSKQYAGGFVRLKTVTIPELEPGEEARRVGAGMALSTVAMKRSSSRVKPEILFNPERRLTQISLDAEPTTTDIAMADDIKVDSDEEEEISPTSPVPEARSSSLSETTSLPHSLDSLKRRRSDSRAEEHRNFSESQLASLSSTTSSRPTKVSRTLPENVTASSPRKTVCVRCWDDAARCDGSAQCARCVKFGLVCVHKRCEGARECVRWRKCPYVHPGDQEKNGEGRVIESGLLSRPPGRKDGDKQQPQDGDSYRPAPEVPVRAVDGERSRASV